MVRAVEIQKDAYYDAPAVQELLHISKTQLGRYCSNGLRCTKRGDRRFFRGQWLIDFLDGKEAVSS